MIYTDQDLKDDVADMFLSDSKDFLNRFKVLEESASYSGLKSKLLVELLFSLECALKSLIFLESGLDGKVTYKKVKKLSHNIEKLANILKPDSKLEFDEIITIDISIYSIFNRYLLESNLVFREGFGVLKKEYFETINNVQWLKSIYNQINTFISYVDRKNPFILQTVNFSDIDLEFEKSKFKKLQEMIS